MFNLTRQERSVLIALGFIFVFGLMFHYVLKNHSIREAMQIIDSDKIYPKVNLNQARYEDLLRLSGVGPALANSIIHYRGEHGPYKTIEEIRFVDGISSKKYSQLVKFFKIK